MSVETELKLAVDPAVTAAAVKRVLVDLGAVHERRTRLENTYYDAPDGAVTAAGAALRLRRDGDHWIQAVKTGGRGQSGLHQRGEYETPCDGALDLAALRAICPLDFLRDIALCTALQPLITTDFTREIWILTEEPDLRVEIAWDRGEARSGSRREPIRELELELKAGSQERLPELALRIAKAIAVRPEDRTKAARGYALRREQSAAPVHAERVAIPKRASAEAAFVANALAAVAQVQRNIPAILVGEDIEGVHQARIGMRRLRAAFRSYRGLVPRESGKRLLDDMRWLCAPMGAARDWDVLGEVIDGADPDPALAALRTHIAVERRRAYRALHRRLRSKRAGQILLRAPAWFEARPWREARATRDVRDLDRPVRRMAPKLLASAHRRIRRKGKGFAGQSDVALHAFRLLVKQTRYTSEMFGDLYGGKRARQYRRALRRLQNRLGGLSDMALLTELVERRLASPEHRTRALEVIAASTHSRKRCRTRAIAAWRPFKAAPPYWAK